MIFGILKKILKPISHGYNDGQSKIVVFIFLEVGFVLFHKIKRRIEHGFTKTEPLELV